MNTKVKGNLLLNADFVQPETAYATFSEGLSKRTIKEISSIINYGHEMLQIYEQHRSDLHIANVVDMLRKMEAVFSKFDYERFEAQRKQQ